MSEVKVALLGFGTIGYGVYTNITNEQNTIQNVVKQTVKITGALIRDPHKERSIAKDILLTTDFHELLAKEKPDVVIEAMGGIEPTLTYIKDALNAGCHVISANKDLIARHGKDIEEIAKANNVFFAYEASVGGGIPLIRTIKELLQFNHIEQIEAILNGTSNFILSYMRSEKASFEDALEIAKAKGYAEPDPTNDVEGYDPFYKAMVLSNLMYGAQPHWEDVFVEGISKVKTDELLLAETLGFRLKQFVSINDALQVSVGLHFVDNTHPLYGVEGVDNAIRFKAKTLGFLTLQGPGAGANATSSAIIEDLVSFYTKEKVVPEVPKQTRVPENAERPTSTYTLLFTREDCCEKLVDILQENGAILQRASSPYGSALLYKTHGTPTYQLLAQYAEDVALYSAHVTNEQLYTRTKEVISTI
ncbi:homoserine dehydrogenase [Priestia taiwanensis]|uniref:Homoserine dehydrogenase n=1 Tax=Priestia taiwanensis TaxID=1347902 RepID=A0A917ARC1_9BACI|nr:homoserine dehydrogenase [Priestia taiwanensis]MBM7363028.1 homoserine dehydrogenase [Priestia taiwanensis]GGE67017.1 homoserine dehydrogenase [Priestia taiwanensis]